MKAATGDILDGQGKLIFDALTAEEAELLLGLRDSHAELRAALERCQTLFLKAMSQFNWAESALSATAIHLLNDVPREQEPRLKK